MTEYSETFIKQLLENYKAERKAISKIVENLVSDGEMVFWDGGSDNPKVQTQFSQSNFLDRLLVKCEDERTYYKKTLADLKRKTDELDKLVMCINRLRGDTKLVIIETYVNKVPVGEYSLKSGKSEETIRRYRNDGVAVIASMMGRK